MSLYLMSFRLPSPRAACYIKVMLLPKGRFRGYFADISMTSQTARAVTPQSPNLLRERLGSIAVLTLNRPDARNSLSEGLIAELHAALEDIHDDAKVRAVVIAANGPAFSAGHDMKELTARRADADRGRAYFAQIMDACSAMMQAIVNLPKPVISAVQGVATAAGCQLVASCDLAVASEAATFATPGVDIGLFCSTPMVALSRNVPRKQAMEMLLTGEPVSAKTAQEIGLVNRVVAAGTEREAAIALAESIALKSAYTVKLGKAAFYRQAEMSLADAYRYAAQVMTENMMARDAEEGIGAFIEKREPKWHDR
jgi:enoyl-CoA hydratase/carnithine racemase